MEVDQRPTGGAERLILDFEEDPVFVQQRIRDENANEGRRGDRRFKTVVCRHWVKGLCMKLDGCDFLHALDSDRMPECRWGEKCQVPDCTFKHTREADRLECAYYSLGFCAHGTSCRYRHIRKAKEELPPKANWDIVFQNASKENAAMQSLEMKRQTEPNANFKVQLCKHFMSGMPCPYGDSCHFAHGEQELRDPSQNASMAPEVVVSNVHLPSKTPLDEAVESLTRSDDAIPNPLADSGADLETPDKGSSSVRYFVLRAEAFPHLAASVKQEVWAVHPFLKEKLSQAFFSAETVIVIFAVDQARQFAGCGVLKSVVEEVRNAPFVETPPEAEGRSFCAKIEWKRTCILPYSRTANLSINEPELARKIPVAFCFEGTELSPEIGHSLLVMLFREPDVNIDKDQIDASLKVFVHVPGPAREMIPILDQTREIEMKKASSAASMKVIDEDKLINPPSTNDSNGKVPVAPGCVEIRTGGFIFAGDDYKFIDEMLGRGLFAVAKEQGQKIETIRPGTPLFLLNLRNGSLFGVFESLDGPRFNLDPLAFTQQQHSQRQQSSFLPVQVPVKVLLECKPISAAAVATHTIPRGTEAAFKSLSVNQTQQLVNLMYIKSGGLDRFKRNNQPMRGPRMPMNQNRMGTEMHDDEARINFSPEFPPGINQSPVSEPNSPDGFFSQKIIVNIAFHPKFKAPHKIIGKGGSKLRLILQETGVHCRVRGEHDESDMNQIIGPIHIVLQAKAPDQLGRAAEMVREAVNEVVDMHEVYVKKGEELRLRRLQRQGGFGGAPF